jgi:hypothetical protein
MFMATVERVRFLDEADEDLGESRLVVDFAVLRSWAGPMDETIVLHTFYQMSCDGYWFEEEETYVLVAWPNDLSWEPFPWPPSDTFEAM